MSQQQFNHIALISRASKNSADTLLAIKDYLLQKKITIYLEKNTADIIQEHTLPTFFENQLPATIDLIIAVGGDGSLLHAAHYAHRAGIPVLGINRGRLGFLTDIHPNDLATIDEILAGHYLTEERFLLSTAVGDALNDIVLLPGSARLIEFDIFINEKFVCQQRADGLIIATPTGSTAYALSGGGPILHPSLNAIVLVPMFPHTLSNRPIVVEGNATVALVISEHNEANPVISCDGSARKPIAVGTHIHIKKHPKTLTLIHPKDYEYFGTLREKLGWNK